MPCGWLGYVGDSPVERQRARTGHPKRDRKKQRRKKSGR